ncbi:50S ribosomal protein L29 [uncultured Meiothermus sp.]|jgi:large subunit ribosomal protein L29|uniref:50S ribosomal protein L29 n=1 Tax=uncultured Meiothermus sp. TaxID=157471 RepID=UPI0026035CD7|nr:50S ribosomal protein L29 [uncultured Meiothermus sp.]
MPTTKPSELRKLPVSELQKRIQDTKKELMELRFQSSIGQLDKNHRMAQARREIARMMTVLGEKAKGIEVVSQAQARPASKAVKKPRAKKA